MIDIRKLKELVRLMVANDLMELDVRDAEEQVTIKRPNPQAVPAAQSFVPATLAPAFAHAAVAAPPGTAPTATAPAQPAATPSAGSAGTTAAGGNGDGLAVIESPMVGTFYSAAGPGKPAFVQVGAKVTPNTIVCLIEAMKIFNEIKAEMSGTVEAMLVKNGQAVEFGQPLFRIRPE